MSKIQKIKDFFLGTTSEQSTINKQIRTTFIKNTLIVISILFLYLTLLGLFFNLIITFISLAFFAIFIVVIDLFHREKISFKSFKFYIFIIIFLLIFTILLKDTKKTIQLGYVFFITITAFALFNRQKMFSFSFLVLLLFDILYFIFNLLQQFEIKHIYKFNILYLFVITAFFFFKRVENARITNFERQKTKENLKLLQEKKIIAFAIHQLRSSINNYVVYGEMKKKNNSKEEFEELEIIKQQSNESLCATFSLLEDVSGKVEDIFSNCSLDKIIEKIISFYKINNKNIKIINFNNKYHFSKRTNHQIKILRPIFITIEIFNLITNNIKTNVNFDFYEDPNYFSYKFSINSVDKKTLINNQNFGIFLEILQENLYISESNFNQSNNEENVFFIQLNFNKKYFLTEEKKIIKEKDIIIDDSKYKLLLGEDDEINQKIYSIGFEKYFDKIDIAENGSEVLKKLENSKYNLLVMDLQMPTMNGIETIEKIRKIEELTGEHLLIIAITANTLIYNRQDILSFGFDDYFIKPFKVKEIYQSFKDLKNQKI